eukprot:3480418-Pyramimonas_sp.AAC.1
MSPLQSTSCSLGAAAMGCVRPQSSRGSDPRSSPQNRARRYHGGSYADEWGKRIEGLLFLQRSSNKKGLRVCYELAAPESLKTPSTFSR